MTTHTARNRHKARELALQLMYAHEQGVDTNVNDLSEYLATENALSPENKNYGRELTAFCIASLETIDALIVKYAANWDLKRMAAIDRNVLRLGIAELLQNGDVPAKVVIDEAVELAKKFGSGESGRFVNGLIDTVYKQHVAVNNPSTTNKDGQGNAPGRSPDSAPAE